MGGRNRRTPGSLIGLLCFPNSLCICLVSGSGFVYVVEAIVSLHRVIVPPTITPAHSYHDVTPACKYSNNTPD